MIAAIRAFVRRNETVLTIAQLATIAVVAVVIAYFGLAVPGAAAATFPALLVPRSRNKKTGNVPSVWIGSNLQESRDSCKGCKHLANKSCYAQFGSPSFAIASMEKAIDRGISYGPERMKETHKNASMLRIGALGDPSRANKRQLRAIIKAAVAQGLSVVGYTHFWKLQRAEWLKGTLMASCDNLQEVAAANAAGWKATVVLPAGTTGTIRDEDGKILAVECPAIAADRVGRKYSCNDCASNNRGALCDASKPGPNVYFADHGPKARKTKLQVIQ